MVSTVEKIDDPVLLKQAALLLEHKNARLQELIVENAELKGSSGLKQLFLVAQGASPDGRALELAKKAGHGGAVDYLVRLPRGG